MTKNADYRKLNDRTLNSSTYHKKDGTKVRAKLKEAARKKIKWEGAFLCGDCGLDTATSEDYYVVNAVLWNTYGNGRGVLCRACLSARVGRPLEKDDFVDCIWNKD